MSTNRVVVLLSDEELARVKERAGMVPLSAWFRALGLGSKKLIEGESVDVTPETWKSDSPPEPIKGTISVDAEKKVATVNVVSVRPHMIHSGTHPIKGCRECAARR